MKVIIKIKNKAKVQSTSKKLIEKATHRALKKHRDALIKLGRT